MSAPGQGQGGAQAGSGGQSGGQSGGSNNQGATTTSTTQYEAPTSASQSSSTATATSTSTSSSTGDQKTVIIGAVIGGIGAALLLCILALWLLQRRKKQQKAKKNGAQPVTYTGLDSAFSGVPFRHSQNSSLSPRPLLLSNSNTAYQGAASPGQTTNVRETDRFLPSYRDSERDARDLSDRDFSSPQPSPSHSPSHSRTHSRTHSQTIARAHSHSHSFSNSSPLTLRDPSEAHILSGHGPMNPEFELPTFQLPTQRDTMGFPIEPSLPLEEIRLHSMTPVLLSPKPRHPLVHQDSLERVVRDGILAPSPAPSDSAPGRLRVISREFPRESPVLGLENPVTIQNPALTRLGGGLGRNESQRTVSSVSSMGPVIGDDELENLGIGVRPHPLRYQNRD